VLFGSNSRLFTRTLGNSYKTVEFVSTLLNLFQEKNFKYVLCYNQNGN